MRKEAQKQRSGPISYIALVFSHQVHPSPDKTRRCTEKKSWKGRTCRRPWSRPPAGETLVPPAHSWGGSRTPPGWRLCRGTSRGRSANKNRKKDVIFSGTVLSGYYCYYDIATTAANATASCYCYRFVLLLYCRCYCYWYYRYYANCYCFRYY